MGRGTFSALLALSLVGVVQADDLFEPPVRLEADGSVIDSGKVWGHSSPCLEDINQDGLPDLIVGDFSGKFSVFKNVGKAGAPVFASAGMIQAGGEPANVRIYCCVGGQARFVDLDADGVRDLVSSSYDPGHCYFFRGLGNQQFEPGVELTDKCGVPVRPWPVQKQTYQSFGSFYTPVDWDADGDFDLLVGLFDGALRLRMNEGTARSPVWAADNLVVEAGGKSLRVEAHNCPCVADWDADGKWDLIVGADDGSVTWFRNAGSKGEPRFEAGVELLKKRPGNGYNVLPWEPAIPGIRVQPEVADFNADGKPDLLVGDFTTVYSFRDLTEPEKQQVTQLIAELGEKGKAMREPMDALRKQFAERYPGEAIFSDEADKAWSHEYSAMREAAEYKAAEAAYQASNEKLGPFMVPTDTNGQAPERAVPHGYVWLLLRK